MDRVLYIGSGGFPFENARSMRMRSFCSLFADLGFEVDVISDWDSSNEICSSWHCLVSRTMEEYKKPNHFKRLSLYYDDVSKALNNEQYRFAFVTEMPERVHVIQSLCKSHGVPTIGESCEWYDSSTWKFGILDLHNIAFQLAHHFWYPRWDAVVSITTLLDAYYKKHGVSSAVIPTILDVRHSLPRLISDAGSRDINFLFAGSFGGTKDGIAPMVEAAVERAENYSARKVVINVLGPSSEQVKTSLGIETYRRGLESGVLVVHGRVPQEQVVDFWRWADYGLFLRPSRRSSNAGFPTKLGEGMAVGTPFVVNRTGDIPLYIDGGHNGFLLDSCSKEDCALLVDALLALNSEEHSTLRVAARNCAERCFDFRVYEDQLLSLICEIDERRHL